MNATPMKSIPPASTLVSRKAEKLAIMMRSTVSLEGKQAEQMLKQNSDKFEKLAQNLIERETLNGEEVRMIMEGQELPPVQNGNKKSDQPDKPADVKAEDNPPAENV